MMMTLRRMVDDDVDDGPVIIRICVKCPTVILCY